MSIHPYRNYFKEFKGDHNIFIETGSHVGNGIELARQAGYKRIMSMDIDGANVAHCQDRFKLLPDDKTPAANGNINIMCGDSAIEIGRAHVRTPVTLIYLVCRL